MGQYLVRPRYHFARFFIMLVIALFFKQFQENVWVIKVFNGIRPAVVALILVPCITAAKAMRLSRLELVFPLLAALLIWLCGVSPIGSFLVAAGGLFYSFWLKDKLNRGER